MTESGFDSISYIQHKYWKTYIKIEFYPPSTYVYNIYVSISVIQPECFI